MYLISTFQRLSAISIGLLGHVNHYHELNSYTYAFPRVVKCHWPFVFRWSRFNNSCRWPWACRKLCQDNRSETPLPPISQCSKSNKKEETNGYSNCKLLLLLACHKHNFPRLRILERAHMLTDHILFTALMQSQPQHSSFSQKSGFEKNGSSISESRQFILLQNYHMSWVEHDDKKAVKLVFFFIIDSSIDNCLICTVPRNTEKNTRWRL